MARILVVEDDTDMQTLLQALLHGEGHEVALASSGEEALKALAGKSPDLVILDVMLPGVNGVEVCRRAREFTYVPILMVTGRDSEIDKIIGLEAGADDYLTKPFQAGELRARVRAQLRRALQWQNAGGTSRDRLKHGNLVLDPQEYTATVAGKALDLTRLEFDLLYYLVSRPGAVRTREDLLSAVWGDDEYIVTRGIDVHISRLRKKIETDPARPKLLLTVHGVGYKFSRETD